MDAGMNNSNIQKKATQRDSERETDSWRGIDWVSILIKWHSVGRVPETQKS
jgi:hypothetical protein